MIFRLVITLAALSFFSAAILEIFRGKFRFDVFVIWGVLTFGIMGTITALQTAGYQLPELTNSAIFGLSGIVFSLGIATSRLPRRVHSKYGNSVPLAVLLLLGLLTTIGIFTDSWAFPVLMIAGFSPLIAISNRTFTLNHLRSSVMAGSAFLSLSIAVMALVIPERFFGSCRLDKCSIWGESIGSLSSGNALGLLFSAVALLGIAFASSKSVRLVIGLSSLFLIEASSGRTSLLAYLSAITAWIFVIWIGKISMKANIALWLVILGSFIFIAFPYSPQDFTFRGELWIYAKSQILENMYFGHGASEWVRSAYSSGIILNYSTHNIWLEALYVSGIFGLVVFVYSLLASKNLWSSTAAHPQVGLFLWLIFTGLTEVPSFIARPYIVPGALLLYYLCSQAESTLSAKSPSGIEA